MKKKLIYSLAMLGDCIRYNFYAETNKDMLIITLCVAINGDESFVKEIKVNTNASKVDIYEISKNLFEEISTKVEHLEAFVIGLIINLNLNKSNTFPILDFAIDNRFEDLDTHYVYKIIFEADSKNPTLAYLVVNKTTYSVKVIRSANDYEFDAANIYNYIVQITELISKIKEFKDILECTKILKKIMHFCKTNSGFKTNHSLKYFGFTE